MSLNLSKIITILSLGLATSTVQAQWEGNWLAGLSVGLSEREGNIDLTINHLQGVNSELIHNQEDVGVVGGLLGGYQVRCNDWLFGAELNIEWQELDREQNGAFTNQLREGVNTMARYHQGNILALTGRFGYEMFPNFLPYVRLGVQSSRDKLTYSISSPVDIAAVDMEGIRRVYRLTAGIGAETPIPMLMGLSLRGEYNYAAKAGAIEAQSLAIDNATLVNASMRPRTNTLLVSFVLNFI